MKLIQEMIENKINFADDYALRKWYKKEIWNYCRAYAFALEYLGLKDNNVNLKNSIMKSFLLDIESFSSKNYPKIKKIISEQMGVINKALDKIQQTKEESGYVENRIFEHKYAFAPIGVYAFEIQEEE